MGWREMVTDDRLGYVKASINCIWFSLLLLGMTSGVPQDAQNLARSWLTLGAPHPTRVPER